MAKRNCDGSKTDQTTQCRRILSRGTKCKLLTQLFNDKPYLRRVVVCLARPYQPNKLISLGTQIKWRYFSRSIAASFLFSYNLSRNPLTRDWSTTVVSIWHTTGTASCQCGRVPDWIPIVDPNSMPSRTQSSSNLTLNTSKLGDSQSGHS